ncbi:CD59 glycoprotein-like [Amphiprion ocellaris]|uniref:CD59 glycoprotein-like n=1 Tax=Amphiprion ocellaris TaxID=80972 RepID=UPI000C3172CD|nr:CD59 glycoprotein-like [Amphiprion ocellaris]
MKTVIVALLVLVVVSQSEALRCYCGGLTRCSSSTQTCSGNANACASVVMTLGSNVNRFQSCYNYDDCMRLKQLPQAVYVNCCMTDLCNR